MGRRQRSARESAHGRRRADARRVRPRVADRLRRAHARHAGRPCVVGAGRPRARARARGTGARAAPRHCDQESLGARRIRSHLAIGRGAGDREPVRVRALRAAAWPAAQGVPELPDTARDELMSAIADARNQWVRATARLMSEPAAQQDGEEQGHRTGREQGAARSSRRVCACGTSAPTRQRT
jgi:hypothetical protein